MSILITMTNTVSMRPVTKADDELLYEIYCSTRTDEVAGFGWEREAVDAFLRMQFDARQRAYKLRYAKCENAIVLCDKREAGSVIIERDDDEISLVDIAILPKFRGKGLATEIIRGLKEDAVRSGRPVTLRVDKQNIQAIALYQKLGFSHRGESALMFSMQWIPAR